MVNMDIKTDKTSDFIIKTFASHFSDASTTFLARVFEKIQDLFEGRYPDYQQSDTAYHDFAHTCRAAVTVSRILDGHIKSGKTPDLGRRDFELVIAATLLHDSGFIKQKHDATEQGANIPSLMSNEVRSLQQSFSPSLTSPLMKSVSYN